jgi:hypothetical protein
MRSRLLVVALLFASLTGSSSASPSITRVWPEFRTADAFDNIGEYFGGPEKTAGRTVLRTQATERAGYYFLVRLSEPNVVPAGASWSLQCIFPGSRAPKNYSFPLPSTQRQPVYELGLTGKDCPAKKSLPQAWRLALLDASGRELVSQQSFLWQ